jgi:inner membrane transporter RhtA
MIPIVLSEMGPLGPKDPLPLGGLASRTLDRIPPAALLLLAIVSIQLSSAFATFLFASLGPAGTAFLTALFSAGVLTLLSPPRIDRRLRDGAILIALFGLAIASMVLPFFLALQRIPLGIATAIAFLGPLGVAVVTSHRLSHFLVIGVAALGVGLLTPMGGGALDPYGLALAALSALAWGAFVPFSKWAGRAFAGNDGLTFSFWIASILLLPFALAEGSVARAGGVEMAGALLVALLNAVFPTVLEFRALQRMSARSYGVLVTLEPAIGALVGALLLHQAIDLRMSAAIACVTLAALGITLIYRDKTR